MGKVAVGDIIDRRYVVRREISRGGMCVVHCARHRLTGREVAVKVLRDELNDDENARKRLIREARAMELSRSQYVVDILDAGELEDGAPYVVMEMLEGRSLQGVLTARHTLEVANTVAVGLHVARALVHAHAHGVVHRDIKPDNVMFSRTAEGEVVAKLIDFGISAITASGEGPTGQMDPAAKITRAGEFFGTPEYIAPECLHLVGVVDKRSDLYSLGIMLYECLAGTVPFSGDFGEVLVKAYMSKAPDLKSLRGDVPAKLAEVVGRAMAVQPDDRFADAAELEKALEAALAREHERTIDASLPIAPPVPTPSQPAPTADPAAVQRRRFARASFVTPVRISLPDGKVAHGKSEDISEGGLLVLTDTPCANGVRAKVRFMSPLAGRVTEIGATTRWVKTARGKAAIGFEFVELPEALRREIADYVELAAGKP